MRKHLKNLNNQRQTFSGIFVRFGLKKNWHGFPTKTVLLKDIKDLNGNIISDHCWFNYVVGFQQLTLKENDIIQFDARVKKYIKGYAGYKDDVYEKPIEEDYKLSHPTKINHVPTTTN